MSLHDQFLQESAARLENPREPGMSEQLRFLFWVADKRDQTKSGPRLNPPQEPDPAYWDLEELEQAGTDMGLEGYDLQDFVSNAATWF